MTKFIFDSIQLYYQNLIIKFTTNDLGMADNNFIQTFIIFHLTYPKNSYKFSEVRDASELLKINIVKENTDHNLEVNYESDIFHKTLINIASLELKKSISDDIELAFLYFKEFEKHIRIKFKIEGYNTIYDHLFKAVKINLLKVISKENNIYHFFINLYGIPSRPKELKNFEEIYFSFLVSSNYGPEIVYNSCCAAYNYKSKNNRNTYHVTKYLAEITAIKSDLANQIYQYGISNDIVKYPGFASNLLIGLHNANDKKAFNLAFNLLKLNIPEGLKAFRGFDIGTSLDVQKMYDTISPLLVETTEIADQKSALLCHFIHHKNTTNYIIEKGFDQISSLVKSQNFDIARAVILNVQYCIRDYEDRKYNILITYLGNTKDFSILDDFFYEFNDLQYFFHLLITNYRAVGFKSSVNRFEQTILKFWRKNQEQMEAHILNLFRNKGLGLLGIKVILAGGTPLKVDFLKLEEEEFQNNAIESICNYPHSLEKLVAMLLDFRNSKFAQVQKNLELQLSDLIFTTYHESLYELIENKLDTRKDKKFLEPLKKALLEYQDLKKRKSIKDLDPYENERDLMDLYYRLEHENNAKIMKSSNEDHRFFTTVKIVRGNAWKIDEKEEVLPMQIIESRSMIDSRAYKNPIAYEQNLDNF